jgi:hypothetical protein
MGPGDVHDNRPDEPACSKHGDVHMYDDGHVVECVECLLSEKRELLLQIDELKERMSEIEHIATLFWNGKLEGPLGCILEICLRKSEKPKCEHKRLSDVVYDGNKRPCLDCEEDVVEKRKDGTIKICNAVCHRIPAFACRQKCCVVCNTFPE